MNNLKSMYEPVMGLEVHVELNTNTKMFCACSADYFGKEPNTQTCPICLGLPGALPYINEEAINKCIQIGLALNCKINPKSYFERKNYFYPDLPKGYQISQLVLPVAVGGWIEFEDPSAGSGQVKKIRINRAHQEEDTGKLTHQGNETLIDFNRSSVPLVEIVTEPDFTNSSQIKDYAKKLQQIFRYIGASEADMEKGQMRLEANISVRPVGQKELPPYRVELKNINSFRFMVAAVEYEIKRQIEAHEKGEKLVQETRGWDEVKKQTYVQRSKEEAHDYRYFPEPDLPELTLEESRVKSLESGMPELPWEKEKKFITEYKVKKDDVRILVEEKRMADFFEEAVGYAKKSGVEPQAVANYIINQKVDLIDASAKQIVDDIKAKKSSVLKDEGVIEGYAKEAIDEHPKAVEDYKKGKEAALQVFIGAVMRKSLGRADIKKAKSIIEKLLG